MSEHINARSGLRTVFIAQILLMLGSCMNFIAPNVDVDAENLSVGAWAVTVLSLLAFAALLMQVIGLNKAGKDAAGYKKAFTFCLIALLCGAVFSGLGLGRFITERFSLLLSNISTILSNLFQIAAAYHMMTASLKLLAENGEKGIVTLGSRLWIAYILGSLLLIFFSVLSTLSGMPAALMAYLCGACGVIRCLALVIFLAKAHTRV